jgi:hypothetical protein
MELTVVCVEAFLNIFCILLILYYLFSPTKRCKIKAHPVLMLYLNLLYRPHQ